MRNEVHLKTFWYVLCKNAWFPWQPLIKNWGVGLQIQSYLGFYLSKSTKIGVKLKLRHMFFPCGPICKSSHLHFYEY